LELGAAGHKPRPLPSAIRPRDPIRTIAGKRRHEHLIAPGLRRLLQNPFHTVVGIERFALLDTQRRELAVHREEVLYQRLSLDHAGEFLPVLDVVLPLEARAVE